MWAAKYSIPRLGGVAPDKVIEPDLLVPLEAFGTALPAETGVLDPAERRGEVGGNAWLMPTTPVSRASATSRARSTLSVNT